MNKDAKILITGSRGLLGTALIQSLRKDGYENVIELASHTCNLMDQKATFDYFELQRPTHVFHLAGKVHGIGGNMAWKGEAFYNNLLINTHVVEACRRIAVTKILAMGTGAVYPYPSPSLPLKETDVFMGRPHGSENAYAQAKRAMLAQLEAYAESYRTSYVYVISANLYGENDNFDINYGHVVPSLIRKFSEALDSGGEVSVWGNGSAQRDFMYSADAARALMLMMNKGGGPINMGSGQIASIADVVSILSEASGVSRIKWDASKPNGQDFRAYSLDALQSTGFEPRYGLEEGLKKTFEWFRANKENARGVEDKLKISA